MDKIIKALTEKYNLSSTFTEISVKKWANLTIKYINQGLDIEEAGRKAAKETFTIGYPAYNVIKNSSYVQSTMVLLQQLEEALNGK